MQGEEGSVLARLLDALVIPLDALSYGVEQQLLRAIAVLERERALDTRAAAHERALLDELAEIVRAEDNTLAAKDEARAASAANYAVKRAGMLSLILARAYQRGLTKSATGAEELKRLFGGPEDVSSVF